MGTTGNVLRGIGTAIEGIVFTTIFVSTCAVFGLLTSDQPSNTPTPIVQRSQATATPCSTAIPYSPTLILVPTSIGIISPDYCGYCTGVRVEGGYVVAVMDDNNEVYVSGWEGRWWSNKWLSFYGTYTDPDGRVYATGVSFCGQQ